MNPLKKIHIVATSGTFEKSLVEEATTYLRRLNFQVGVSPEILGEDSIYAHSKEQRFQNLKFALEDPHADVIWCMRGGAGASGLIPLLKNLPKPRKEKIFIGYSDVTCLHLFFSQNWGWKPIHGPLLKEMTKKMLSPDSEVFMEDFVLQKKNSLTLDDLVPLNKKAEETQKINKKITGGNLSLIQSSFGTSWQIECEDKILFLEDVNERAYRTLERFEHMKQVGVLNDLAALILGDFGFSEQNLKEEALYKVRLKQFSETLSFPVFKTEKIGHGKNNFPIQIGQEVSLEISKNSKLTITYAL